VKVYRARAWRGGPVLFDPLDSASSVAGPKGWRYNDLSTEILYTAQVEALAILEVAVRPGWETIQQVLVATIEIPENCVVSLADLGMVLPNNWNARPVADDSRLIAREFLDAVARLPAGTRRPAGLRVPSVLSSSDFNVLLDPSRKGEFRAAVSSRMPFKTPRHWKLKGCGARDYRAVPDGGNSNSARSSWRVRAVSSQARNSA
jgi:RES domain-containing protein